MSTELKRILREKILTDDKLKDIEYYLLNIYSLSGKIEEVLKVNKENKIEDRNDFEYQMYSLDGYYIEELGDIDYRMLDNGGYDDFNKKILEADLKNIIDEYLATLTNLVVYIDNSLNNLKIKTDNFYRLYFKTEIHKIIDFENINFKYGDLNNYLLLKKDYENLEEICETNPYKIILNTYLYYLDIISIFIRNIKENEDNIYKQAKIVKYGLPLDIYTFENLKKWEDSIEIKGNISIYDLIKNSN